MPNEQGGLWLSHTNPGVRTVSPVCPIPSWKITGLNKFLAAALHNLVSEDLISLIQLSSPLISFSGMATFLLPPNTGLLNASTLLHMLFSRACTSSIILCMPQLLFFLHKNYLVLPDRNRDPWAWETRLTLRLRPRCKSISRGSLSDVRTLMIKRVLILFLF